MYNSILESPAHTYDTYDFDISLDQTLMANNRLFCTFTPLNELDNLISDLTKMYDIMYHDIFKFYRSADNMPLNFI